MSEWQPIENIKPNIGDRYIGKLGNKPFSRIVDICWSGEHWINHDGIVCNPTHWMPLPKPPNESWHRCKFMPQKYRIEVDEWPNGYFSPSLKTSTETVLERIRFCPYCGSKADE